MKFLLISGALLLSTVSTASADWRTERTTTGPNGVTSQATTSVTRTDGTRVVQTQVDRSNGTGHTREVVQTWDEQTNSWTRSVTGETADGRTWRNTGSGSCTGGACSRQSTFNGTDGRTIESQSNSRFDRSGGVRNWNWSSNRGRSGGGERVWRRLR